MSDGTRDWVCDACAENDPEIYDDGHLVESSELTCERCERVTSRLTKPRRYDSYDAQD